MPEASPLGGRDAASTAKNAWLARVLGVVVPARAGDPPRSEHTTEWLFDLLERWRPAERHALDSLRQLGQNVLRDPDVQGSPVAAEVAAVIPQLAGLIPVLSDPLEEALGKVEAAQGDEARDRARVAVRKAITAYRAGLEQEDRLPDLEELAVMLFGQKPFYSPLLRLLADFERAMAG